MWTVYPAGTARREVHLEAQGNFIAIAKSSEAQPQPIGGERGEITEFSKASRRRLIQQCARMNANTAVFVTLTYAQVFPDGATAKNNLRAFLERIRRRFPDSSGVWRLEYQDRGAPHFHIIFYNLPFIPKKKIGQWWAEIVGYADNGMPPFTRIEFIRSRRGVMYYVSKYVAKTESAGASDSGFNYVAYLHAGRWWGMFNRLLLPYAKRLYAVIEGAELRDFYNVKGYFRRFWSGFNKQRFKGGTMLAENTTDLFDGCLRQLTELSSGSPRLRSFTVEG